MPIPVFFSPEMVAPPQGASPSASKPTQVVASWQKLGVPLEVRPVEPVTVDELKRAHDPHFVDGVLSGVLANGFGNRHRGVAASLPYTSGSMLTAARALLRDGGLVAAAPCSGFHHAGWSTAEGFCTFNGLMVTAFALLADGLASRVGILDFDMHYGNGTDDILRHDRNRVLPLGTAGMRERIVHFTAGADYKAPYQAPTFFQRLPAILERFNTCDIVLYQAGADPHVDDPYGGWLTTPELRRRDAMVFEALRDAQVPVVWDLAGGYQVEEDGSIPKVLEIHDNSMLECARVYLGG